MNIQCKIRIMALLSFILVSISSFSQTILNADGPGNTYELINSVLAPGYDAVEHPDHTHLGFGRHIEEVWDDELDCYVFEFYIHVGEDDDRSLAHITDRQRIEIKTYANSPANLKGVVGETVIYKWKFRLPEGFQVSSNFTHLHQIKPVGGDDGNPIFTLTARKGNPNKMEVRHNNVTNVRTANLSLFEGQWVEVVERIKIHPVDGAYSIEIKNIKTGATILSYTDDKLMTIRASNTFIRPKWGIYRSLQNAADLRDETVRFNNFSIEEENVTSFDKIIQDNDFSIFSNPDSKELNVEYWLDKSANVQIDIYSLNGTILKELANEYRKTGTNKQNFDLSFLETGYYLVRLLSNDFTKVAKFIVEK